MKKLLLLHGWDWRNYPQFNSGSAWTNRIGFIKSLQSYFEVDCPSLPGFADSVIPDQAWDLDDYANWLEKLVSEGGYDGILGYSFGGAVLTHWAHSATMHRPIKRLPTLLLVSPAIVRRYQKAGSPTLKLLKPLKQTLPGLYRVFRHFYLIYVVRNPFYANGGPFQRVTYCNIVGRELSSELSDVLNTGHDVRVIFGAMDTATPPDLIVKAVPSAHRVLSIIEGGGHNIATSHTSQLVAIITDALDKSDEDQSQSP